MCNDKEVSVYVNGFGVLSEAVQKLAFEKGWTWNSGTTTIKGTASKYLNFSKPARGFSHGDIPNGKVLDARCEFEEIAQWLVLNDFRDKLRQQQDSGIYIIYADAGRTQFRGLYGYELELFVTQQKSACDFSGREENYLVTGVDVPPRPLSWINDKYVLTGELRKPAANEYYVDATGGSVELHTGSKYTAPSEHLFGGKRWICKRREPAYKPHTIDTVVLGVVVAQKAATKRRHMVIGVTDTEVQIGLVNYPFATALERFVDVYGNPYGVKQ